MDFAARIQLIGLDGAPASVALDLEAYNLLDNKWHPIADLLKLSRVTPQLANENGHYTIAFSLQDPGPTVLLASVAAFRMVVRPPPAGSAASVIVAPVQIAADTAHFALDFGTALFLGDRGFAVTGGDAPDFGAAVALASQDATIAAAQRAFYAQPGAVGAAARQLADCQANVVRLTSDNAALTKRADAAAAALQTCTAERASLADQLEAAVAEVAAKSHALDTAQADAAAARTELETAQTDLRNAVQAHTRASDQLLAAQHMLEARDAELAQLRDAAGDGAVFHRLRDQLTAETARATAAETQLAAVREQHRVAAPAGDLVSNFVSSLGQVNRALSDSAIPYRIGRTDVSLKTFVGGAGDLFYLPDAGYSIRDSAVSEVRFEITPDEPVAAPVTDGLVVPDLLGLTETAVIRVLSSLFLKAEKAVATVAAGSEKHGRALRQLPAAGTSAARGSTVLVVYGAAEGA